MKPSALVVLAAALVLSIGAQAKGYHPIPPPASNVEAQQKNFQAHERPAAAERLRSPGGDVKGNGHFIGVVPDRQS